MVAIARVSERSSLWRTKSVDVNSIVTDVILSIASLLPESSRFNCHLSNNRLSVANRSGRLGSALYYLMMDLVLVSKRCKQRMDITISSRRRKSGIVVLEIEASGPPNPGNPGAEPFSRDWRLANEAVAAEGGRLQVETKPARRYLVELPEARE
jgi:hypothetical protein